MTTPFPGLSAPDHARMLRLRKMKSISLGLLIFAAIVYALTFRLPQDGGWGFVTTAAEAAMVGGLADWFAVTALFKYPMGIPIPHTAIIPRKKDDVAGMLQDFLAENFLTPDIVREHVLNAGLTARLGNWLRDPDNAHKVASEVSGIGQKLLARVDPDEVGRLASTTLLPRLAQEEVSPAAGRLMERLVKDGVHHGAVDLVVNLSGRWLLANPATFQRIVSEKAPDWAPAFLNDRLTSWGYQQAVDWLVDVRNDPNHKARLALDDLLLKMADDLQHDDAVMRRTEALKRRVLSHPSSEQMVVRLWGALDRSLTDALIDEESPLWRRGEESLIVLGDRLVNDPALSTRTEHALADGAAWLVGSYGRELTSVISHTIESWDGMQASQTIELHVGRDLQFIRINGTVVGALAGLVIHTISVLVA